MSTGEETHPLLLSKNTKCNTLSLHDEARENDGVLKGGFDVGEKSLQRRSRGHQCVLLALAAIAVVAAVVAAALAFAATRLDEHGTLITEGCCPARPTLPELPACPPWCVCPDVRAWWGSRQSVVTTPPEKAVDDAPRLLYPIPGAAEARVVPVDPAADELPPPPLTVYPLSP